MPKIRQIKSSTGFASPQLNDSRMVAMIFILDMRGAICFQIKNVWYIAQLGTGQNLWGTLAGTIDRGRRLFFEKN